MRMYIRKVIKCKYYHRFQFEYQFVYIHYIILHFQHCIFVHFYLTNIVKCMNDDINMIYPFL